MITRVIWVFKGEPSHCGTFRNGLINRIFAAQRRSFPPCSSSSLPLSSSPRTPGRPCRLCDCWSSQRGQIKYFSSSVRGFPPGPRRYDDWGWRMDGGPGFWSLEQTAVALIAPAPLTLDHQRDRARREEEEGVKEWEWAGTKASVEWSELAAAATAAITGCLKFTHALPPSFPKSSASSVLAPTSSS